MKKQDKFHEIEEPVIQDIFCSHCGCLINDYHADLKCPQCKTELEGEVKQLMINFKKYLDDNNLICIGDQIIDRNEDIQLEVEIREFIEQYNIKLQESAFQGDWNGIRPHSM